MSLSVTSADKKYPLVPYCQQNALRNLDLVPSILPSILNVIEPLPRQPNFYAPILFVVSFVLYLPTVFVYLTPKEEVSEEPRNTQAEIALAVALLAVVKGVFNYINCTKIDCEIARVNARRSELSDTVVDNPKEEVSPTLVSAALYHAANADLGPEYQYALRQLSCSQIVYALPHAATLLGRHTVLAHSGNIDRLLTHLMNRFNPHAAGVLTQSSSFDRVFGQFRDPVVDITILESGPARELFIQIAGLFDACVARVDKRVTQETLNALHQYKKGLIGSIEEFQSSALTTITFIGGETADFSKEFLQKHSDVFKKHFASEKHMALTLDVPLQNFLDLLHVCENGKESLSVMYFSIIANLAAKYQFDSVTDYCLEKYLENLVVKKDVLVPMKELNDGVFSRSQISPEEIAKSLVTYSTPRFISELTSRFEIAQSLAQKIGISGVQEKLLEDVFAFAKKNAKKLEALKINFCGLALAGKKKEAEQASIEYYRALEKASKRSKCDSWRWGVGEWEREYFVAFYKSPEGSEILHRETFGLVPEELRLLLQ